MGNRTDVHYYSLAKDFLQSSPAPLPSQAFAIGDPSSNTPQAVTPVSAVKTTMNARLRLLPSILAPAEPWDFRKEEAALRRARRCWERIWGVKEEKEREEVGRKRATGWEQRRSGSMF